MRRFINIIIVFSNIFYCFSIRYDNYTLYRGIPINRDQLFFFKNLSNNYKVNFWRDPSKVKKPVEFIISPEDRYSFLKNAQQQSIYLTTVMENVQSAFDEQTVKEYIRRNMKSYDWQNYFGVNDIYSWLKDLEKAHPEEMRLDVIGRTHEGRKIFSAHVYLKKGPKNRPRVIVEGGIHAREWISCAFVTYFLNQIVTAPESDDAQLKRIAEHYEWIFVPVTNPDGYEYSHTDDRLWRKNRRDSGVDLNRNFGYLFGSVGVSFNRNSEIYAGETAFSERESSALRNLVIQNNEHLDFYLSFHSYGQHMIIPFAHTKAHAANFYEVRDYAMEAGREIQKHYGTVYTIGTAYDTVGYLVSGASTCWVKHTYRTPYVLTMELRDTGNFGFALLPQYILPTCKETMAGMLSFLSVKPRSHDQHFSYDYEVDHSYNIADSQCNKILDNVVILCNVILFIIVRFY